MKDKQKVYKLNTNFPPSELFHDFFHIKKTAIFADGRRANDNVIK